MGLLYYFRKLTWSYRWRKSSIKYHTRYREMFLRLADNSQYSDREREQFRDSLQVHEKALTQLHFEGAMENYHYVFGTEK